MRCGLHILTPLPPNTPTRVQATPEVYNLYDDIVLLREGRIVYHGPREALPPYMAGIGFPPPVSVPALLPALGTSAAPEQEEEGEGKEDVADWLLSVITHPHGAYLKAKAAAAAASTQASRRQVSC